MLRPPKPGRPEWPPVIRATHQATPKRKLSQDSLLLFIEELLATHISDPTLNVDWLAGQLDMNRKTLYRRVLHQLHQTPSDLIRQFRLRRAVELLKAGHLITETANLVGFHTPSHFASVFKEFYHQTPTEFITSRHKEI